jgi:hypothetical protein
MSGPARMNDLHQPSAIARPSMLNICFYKKIYQPIEAHQSGIILLSPCVPRPSFTFGSKGAVVITALL